jgi:hypothetical protein
MKEIATTEMDSKTQKPDGSTGLVATSENAHGPSGTSEVVATNENDSACSVGVEKHAAVPRVITDAEAPIAAKAMQVVVIGAHEMPRAPASMNGTAHRPATVEGGISATDTLGSSLVPNSGLPETMLRRQVANPGATSRPGAFDVTGVNGEFAVEEVFDEAVMVEPAAAEPIVSAPLDVDGLAVAAPVLDPDDLEDARPVVLEDEQAKLLERKKQTQFWVSIGALSVIAMVIFVIIFVVVQNETDDKNATKPSGTSAPTQPSRASILMPLLPEKTRPEVQLNFTPQGRAFEWVIQDPNFDSYSEKRLQQRFALATFYYSTDGEDWGPMWLDRSKHECQWEYFIPTGEQYDVLEYRYSELKNIDGPCVPSGVDFDNSTLVNATSMLDHDDYLYLAFADQPLAGEIPPEITMLTKLKMIRLDGTNVEGTIPTMLDELPGLIALGLERTKMTGTIPTELGQLTELRNLVISMNQGITGYLPTEIGILSNLEVLTIIETNVTGTIPIEYTALVGLLDLRLSINKLTGTLPTELGLMTRLDWLELYNNELVSNLWLVSRTCISARLK